MGGLQGGAWAPKPKHVWNIGACLATAAQVPAATYLPRSQLKAQRPLLLALLLREHLLPAVQGLLPAVVSAAAAALCATTVSATAMAQCHACSIVTAAPAARDGVRLSLQLWPATLRLQWLPSLPFSSCWGHAASNHIGPGPCSSSSSRLQPLQQQWECFLSSLPCKHSVEHLVIGN